MKQKVLLLLILALCGVNQILPAQDPNEYLIAYWPMDGDANDASGNNHHGTLFGPTRTADRFGNPNSAYSFDGIDDYIVVENSELLNPENISISCWYKTISFEGDGNNGIVEKAFTSHVSPHYQYHLGVTGDLYTYSSVARFAIDISIGSTDRRLHTEEHFWDVGEWYFLCATYDGISYKLFVNNILIDEMTISGSVDNFGQDLYIGRLGNRPAFTPGVIDDVRIYNRALTEDEIDVFYTETRCFNLPR